MDFFTDKARPTEVPRVRRERLLWAITELGTAWVDKLVSDLQRKGHIDDDAVLAMLEERLPSDVRDWPSSPSLRLVAENFDIPPAERDERGRVVRRRDACRGRFGDEY